MENVLLIVHLILALALIGVVLMQRSEGGALGIGGGGSGGGLMSGRSAATALSKVTWALAVAFLVTSMTLVILGAGDGSSSSVINGIGEIEGSTGGNTGPALPPGLTDGDLLPPAPTDAPALPPIAE